MALFSSVRAMRHLRGSSRDIAIDLGTANTVVYTRDEGIVLLEPSVIAIDERTGEVQAVGAEAKRMIGRTPATIRATRPLRSGVITDFEVTEQMLRHFMRRALDTRFLRARVMLCVPSGLTAIERNAVEEATRAAGARAVYLIEEPLAAAIGAALPVAEPVGSMVLDIGGGTTEVAIIALGGMVVWRSLRAGGYEMDDAIVGYIKREHNLLIGEEHAEQLKIKVGTLDEQGQADVSGRDLLSGLLRRRTVTANEVQHGLESTIVRIVEAVKETLEQTPPELLADITDSGIVLVGGGALVRGLQDRLRRETGLAAHLVEEPLTCVAMGAGRCLEDLETIARLSRADARGARRVADQSLRLP
jgi:rod shape-determining protein MreB